VAAPARLARLRDRTARPNPDAMTLGEHLAELRQRLVVCICSVAVGAVITYVLYDQILAVLQAPYCQAVTHTSSAGKCAFYVTQPLQGFALRLNVSAYGGLLIAVPVLFYELWRFVTPGLKANEKRYALPFTLATAVLFALGAFVAYLTFPHAMRFLLDVSGPKNTIVAILSPNSYVQLILVLMAAFGVTFEFPVVLVALELAGVLTPAKLTKFRRWAIIGMVLFAGIVTPSSDPFSMLALAIPLLIFYETSIIIGKMLGK
jgi:sec-independent protein translocase protein TatC